ncbi:MAG: transposase [Kiritimatiellales bacterium]|jgi:REP element-mobilizing transposase RayT
MVGNYDPEKHHRQSIRLQRHDYSGGGIYFVTVCAHRDFINEGAIFISPLREIIVEEWQRTALLRKQVHLDEFVVMPDHFHALVRLDRGVALGDVVGAFKAAVSRSIRRAGMSPDRTMRIWHRNYHERIIRDAEELDRTRIYIRMNPWKTPFVLPVAGGFVRAAGNPALWNFPKIGILCSRTVPSGVDFVPPVDGEAVYMSGFHSPPEKEIFTALLARRARIIYCPAWPIAEASLLPFTEALKENRLLVVETAGAEASLDSAFRRNEFVMRQADRLWIPYCTPGGMLDGILKRRGN